MFGVNQLVAAINSDKVYGNGDGGLMSTVEIEGRVFTQIVGSDLERDGMYIELAEGGVVVAEIFYSDVTHMMSLTTFTADVPLEEIEHLIAEAKVRLQSDAARL